MHLTVACSVQAALACTIHFPDYYICALINCSTRRSLIRSIVIVLEPLLCVNAVDLIIPGSGSEPWGLISLSAGVVCHYVPPSDIS